MGRSASPLLRLLVALVVATFALVLPARAESLQEVIAYVYQTDAGLQAQRAAVRAADEGLVQARAGFGPQASATYAFGRQEIDRRGLEGSAYNPTTSAVVVQPLYTGGRQTARVAQATGQVFGARENLRRYEADLLQRVINAYTNVQRDVELVRISADAVKVLGKQLDDTLAKARARTVTLTDTAQSRARLASARTQLTFAQGQLAISRGQYLGAIGRPPGALQPVTDLPEAPRGVEAAFRIAETNNPNLLLAAHNEEVSRGRIAEARAGRQPNVSFRVEGSRQPVLPYARAGDVTTITSSLQVTQSLFSSGIISSQIRQAQQENLRDRLNVEATRKLIIQGVVEAWEALASAREALGSQQEEVVELQTAFLGVREEERYALRSTLEILNAEAELRAAQIDLIRSRATEFQRRAQLLAALGLLRPELINPSLSTYDPGANLESSVAYRLLAPFSATVGTLDRLGAGPAPGARPVTREDQHPASLSDLPPPPEAGQAVQIIPTSEIVERAERLRRQSAESSSSERPR